MFNVQQITSRLAEMSDAQLAQYARMHKDDPYVLPLASSEFKRRQQIRQSGQMQQGGPKPTVADQEIAMMGQDALPEERGIGVLPEQSLAQMADGGIAGYAEGGTVNMAGGTKGGEKFNPDAYMQDPNVDKFLRYLNVYEGSPKANQLVGFKEFKGFDDHPRTPVVFNKKGDKSDAAGMFQILSKTWDYQSKKLGLNDFSPENQKRAAIGILKDIGALPDIVKGNFDAAKAKATKQWASLPGSTIGKSTGQIPRLKPQAEAILAQPVREAQNTAPAQPQSKKEKSLKDRIFDALPFTSAGAAGATNAAQKPQTFAPTDEAFYNRLEAARNAYKERFGKEMPITDLGRTRYEQQQLVNRAKRGDPNVYMPVDPKSYPGREVFHTNAADIPTSVPETFLREFGLERRFGKKDPVHATAIPDWKPAAGTQVATEAKPAPAPVPAPVVNQAVPTTVVPAQRNQTAQTTPAPQTRTQPGITSLIPSANAADVTPANRVQTPPPAVVQQNRISPAPVPVATNTAPAPVPTPKPVAKTAVKDDAVYDPMTGALIFGGAANDVGPKTESPLAALTLGAADVVLGIPEAIANTVAQNYYNLPFGKTYSWKEASEAAKDNPIVQAAGMLRSGKWFGVENDPAYRKDPLSVITALPSLGVEGIAERFGLDKDAANLALQNALLLAPIVKRGVRGDWQVQPNVPKKQGKEVPTDEGIAQLKTEADAATAKVEAPRLSNAPSQAAVEVSPEGVAKLPSRSAAEIAASEKTGLQNLYEDLRARDAAVKRAQTAENARAAAAAKGKPGAAEAFLANHPWTKAGVDIAPFAALSAGTDVSNAPVPSTTTVPVPAPNNAEVKPTPDNKVDQAKKVAENLIAPPPAPEAEAKTSGFTNDDILTLGLNMMMAQPGQPGGKLSQLASNIGRSGLATLQGRREREKLAAEQSYKDMYGKYITKMAEHIGAPTGEDALITKYAKDRNISYADAYDDIVEGKSQAKYAQIYETARANAEKNMDTDWIKRYPDAQTWMRSLGVGGFGISPQAQDAMKKVLGTK